MNDSCDHSVGTCQVHRNQNPSRRNQNQIRHHLSAISLLLTAALLPQQHRKIHQVWGGSWVNVVILGAKSASVKISGFVGRIPDFRHDVRIVLPLKARARVAMYSHHINGTMRLREDQNTQHQVVEGDE